MTTCARCGLADETVLDLDTGSTCHPELRDCIQALKTKCETLSCENDALQFDMRAAREQLDLANARADFWQADAAEMLARLERALDMADTGAKKCAIG